MNVSVGSCILAGCLVLAPCVILAKDGGTAFPSKVPMALDVDLRDLSRSLVHVRERIPVSPGSLTLVYPKWAPGEHSPSGPVEKVAGLRLTAGGKPLPWRRDEVDMFAFHLTIPAPCSELDLEFDLIVPSTSERYELHWAQVLFHPKGWTSDATPVQGQVRIPDQWRFASALELETMAPGVLAFRPVSLTTLADSPLALGVNMTQISFGQPGDVSHRLNLFGPADQETRVDEATRSHLTALVTQAQALFGARHYDHYDFLVSLRPGMTAGGLEHHQSSEITISSEAFTQASQRTPEYLGIPSVLPHEFVHSWNGKYRRPTVLATEDYQAPMRGRLLWVYEGLTEYLGFVLAARSGLATEEETRDTFAYLSATTASRVGRTWRSLEDTTNDPILGWKPGNSWVSYSRDTDFYFEGALVWLEADALIRDQSHGQRSLDDFCRAFFGGKDTSPQLLPYDLPQVIEVLNRVQTWDWLGFFTTRIQGLDTPTPAAALAACGWRLGWTEKASTSETFEGRIWKGDGFDTSFGLGLRVQADGLVPDLELGSPASRAGMAPKMKILGVNGKVWSIEGFKQELGRRRPLEFVVAQNGLLKTIPVPYLEGEKHPHLEPIPGKADLLAAILAPRVK